MAKKESNQRNHRSFEAWTERKRERNSTPEKKEHQRLWRIQSIAESIFILTDKRTAEYNRLIGE